MRAILLLFMGLAACDGPKPIPCPPKVQPLPYAVPTPVKCINPNDLDPEPGYAALTKDARNDAAILQQENNALRGWGRSLLATAKPCTKDPS
jgi:hypothetical protein